MNTETSSSSSLSEPFRIRCNGGSFEVYKIEVLQVTANRKFKEITMCNGDRYETIYRREEDDLPINQPLSLSGFEPDGAYNNFTFTIGDEDWGWHDHIGIWTNSPYNKPISLIIKDRDTDSRVKICCEWLSPSTLAQVRILFLDEELEIKIMKGHIHASPVSHDDPEEAAARPERKQFLRCLPSSVRHGQIISLDRSVIALPLNISLQLNVDLTYSMHVLGEERTISVSKTGAIEVPTKSGVHEITFEPEGVVSPVVKVEFCRTGLFGRPRYEPSKLGSPFVTIRRHLAKPKSTLTVEERMWKVEDRSIRKHFSRMLKRMLKDTSISKDDKKMIKSIVRCRLSSRNMLEADDVDDLEARFQSILSPLYEKW